MSNISNLSKLNVIHDLSKYALNHIGGDGDDDGSSIASITSAFYVVSFVLIAYGFYLYYDDGKLVEVDVKITDVTLTAVGELYTIAFSYELPIFKEKDSEIVKKNSKITDVKKVDADKIKADGSIPSLAYKDSPYAIPVFSRKRKLTNGYIFIFIGALLGLLTLASNISK